MKSIADLNLREIELFVIASRAQSLREASRRSGLLPAHVSKIMKKLEEKLQQQLFTRTTSGVALTAKGGDLLKIAERLLEVAQQFDPDVDRASRLNGGEKLWTIGSISFIASYLLAPQVRAWRQAAPRSRFRLIEFTHNQLVPFGLQNAFELAVHIGRHEWTQTWETMPLTRQHWKLYGRRGHALGEKCKQADALEFPFIVPTDWHRTGYVEGEDFCPLSVRQRQRGDEASTAETALELVGGSDQLTFVPEVLANAWVERGLVQEIVVSDWPVVEKEIFLTAKADKVPQKIMRMILKSFDSPNA